MSDIEIKCVDFSADSVEVVECPFNRIASHEIHALGVSTKHISKLTVFQHLVPPYVA